MGALNAFYAAWHQLADFRFVYIREAHPVEGRVSPENVSQGIEVSQPRTLDERAAVTEITSGDGRPEDRERRLCESPSGWERSSTLS